MNVEFDERLLIARAEDTVRLSERYSCPRHTDFLSPGEVQLIKNSFVSGAESIQVFEGGYSEAERVMLVSYPDFLDGYEAEDFLSVLLITGRDISSLSHRDFLGSILALGIKREKIGDILVSDNEVFVFAAADIADYIADNLKKIGRVGVHIERKGISEVKVPEKKTEKIKGTVQSVRFDAVLSTALRLSRGKAAQLIESEKAALNFIVCKSCSCILKEGDTFSVRGYGRFKLENVGGYTKKGRVSIEILKYV